MKKKFKEEEKLFHHNNIIIFEIGGGCVYKCFVKGTYTCRK